MRSLRFTISAPLLLASQALCQQIISEHVFDVGQSRNSPPAANAPFDVPFRFREQTPRAWKRRNTSLGPLSVVAQDVLGTIYGTESGAFNPSFTSANGLSTAGLADTGTRLMLRFSGVPQGVRILAPAGSNGTMSRIATGSDGTGPYSPIAGTVTIGGVPFAPVTVDGAGNGSAVWEVVTGDITSLEEFASGIVFSYDAGAGTGSIWISGAMAPTTDPQQTPASRPSFALVAGSKVKVAHFRNGIRFIDRTPLPSARIGQVYSAALSGSLGSPGLYVGQPVFEVLSGQLPPGLSLSQAGLVSGTPQTAGSYDFRVRIRSTGDGVTVESPVLNITVLDALRVNPLPDAVEDLPYSSSFDVRGGRPPYKLDYYGTVGPAPSLGPGFSPNEVPRIAGFAAPAGSYGFDINVTDADGKSLRTTVPLRILPASGRPTFREPAP